MMIDTTVTKSFVILPKNQKKSFKQKNCNNFNVDRSTVHAYCWPINSVYLLTSCDAIWTDHVLRW